MLYLLFVLTFLCGILFYGLSPHDKGLDMTARQAEGMIATFLAQHQAARDYLYTWLGASNDATTGNLQTGVYENFLKADFEKMIPWGVISDMCRGNNVTPGQGGNDACFVSKVVDDAGKHYVITYGGWTGCTAAEMNDSNHYECYLSNNVKRPDWWPSQGTRMRRFESWRRAIANRTRGSISCGTLVEFPESSGNWCIDNGEKVYKNENATHPVCMNQVPLAVISALPYASGPAGLDDLLFCVSEFKQGQDNYQSVAEHFYDGFANAGVAQHTASGNSWADLGSSSSPSNLTMATNWQGKPYFDLHGYLRTGIRLGHSYTLTVLLSGYSDAKAVSCDILGIADDSDTDPGQVIFKKLPDTVL